MLVVVSILLDRSVCRIGARELVVVWVEPSKRLFHGALSRVAVLAEAAVL